MESELSSACLEKIRAATKPMSFSEISAACLGRAKLNIKQKAELTAALKQLTDRTALYEWPLYGKSKIFSSRPFQRAIEDALVPLLDSAPSTVSKAAETIRKAIGNVSEDNVRAELRRAASKLANARKIVQVAINRQSVVYMSPSYLERLSARAAADANRPFDQLIVATIKGLESGPGNFVRVEDLRNSRAITDFIDATVISLADQGKLILGRYGGPRPEDDVEKSHFLEDQSGQLFIGIALPRNE